MARVEPTDVRNSLGASLGGVQTDVGADRVGAGMTVLGTALDRLGDESNRAVAIVARGYNQRANERVYLEGQQDYWSFESELLRGKDGILLRRAEDFEGSTLEATQRLNDHVREYISKMKTGPGRDAFAEFASKEIARTRDQVAAYEAENLEGLRVSRAGAAIETRMQKTAIEQPDRFLPRIRPDGTASYADPELVQEVEQNLEMINRGWHDDEVAMKAQQLIAENAYKSVFAQLDLSPTRIPIASKIQEAYEPLWTPQQREAVNKRIMDEGAYSSMDAIVSSSYSAVLSSDATPSEKALRDHAASTFKATFKEQYGIEAPDDMVQEVKRRASVDLGLRLEADKQAHDELRGAQQTNIIKLIGSGDHVAVSREVTRLLQDAHGEKDTEFAAWLLKVQENVNETGSGFPKETTARGLDMLYRSTEGLSRAEIVAQKPFMSEADFTAWAGPALGMKGTTPSPEVLGAALDAARTRVTGKGPYAKTAAGDKTGEYARQYQRMLGLSREYYDVNGKLPDRVELEQMATALHLSFDDRWHSGGFEGTLADLFDDPSSASFDVAQPRDRRLLQAAQQIVQNDERLKNHVNDIFDIGDRLAPKGVTVEELASNPRLTAEILRLGLLQNMPLSPMVEGLEPRRFREDAADEAVAESKR